MAEEKYFEANLDSKSELMTSGNLESTSSNSDLPICQMSPNDFG